MKEQMTHSHPAIAKWERERQTRMRKATKSKMRAVAQESEWLKEHRERSKQRLRKQVHEEEANRAARLFHGKRTLRLAMTSWLNATPTLALVAERLRRRKRVEEEERHNERMRVARGDASSYQSCRRPLVDPRLDVPSDRAIAAQQAAEEERKRRERLAAERQRKEMEQMHAEKERQRRREERAKAAAQRHADRYKAARRNAGEYATVRMTGEELTPMRLRTVTAQERQRAMMVEARLLGSHSRGFDDGMPLTPRQMATVA